MRKKSALAALFVSAALIAGACGGGGASIVGSYKPGEGGTGGTLLVGDYKDVDSLHPYYYGTVMSANVLATTWDGLVTLTMRRSTCRGWRPRFQRLRMEGSRYQV